MRAVETKHTTNMETLILMAHYESTATPVAIVTKDEARQTAREHIASLNPDEDLCPHYYAVYGRAETGFITKEIEQFDP